MIKNLKIVRGAFALVFIGILFFAGAQDTKAATTICKIEGGFVVCNAITPLPSNCVSSVGGKMSCSDYPTGYSCGGPENSITCEMPTSNSVQTSTTVPNSCQRIVSPTNQRSWDCPLKDPVPSNCAVGAASAGRMYCMELAGDYCVPSGDSLTCIANQTQQQTSQQLGKCGAEENKLGYCLLEPLPGLQNASNVNFAQFLGLIFNLLLIAGALLAVATLVYAGISYILSEAFETKGEARKRMVAAMYGLVILLGAWLLLNTINPALLKFDLSSIGTRGTGNNSGSNVNGSGGNNIGNAQGSSTLNITVTGGNELTVCKSKLPTREQMRAMGGVCRALNKTAVSLDKTVTVNGEVCGVIGCK